MLYVTIKVRNSNAYLLHTAVELRGFGSPGFFVVVFFTSMMFYLIKDTDLLKSLSFYIWGERS